MSLDQKLLNKVFVKENGIFTPKEFEKFVQLSSQIRRSLEQIIMERGLVSRHYFLELLGRHWNVPLTELRIAEIDRDTLRHIPENFAIKHLVIPFGQEGRTLKVAMENPGSRDVIESLERSTGMKIVPHVSLENSIRRAFVFYRGSINEVLSNAVSQIVTDGSAQTNSAIPLLEVIINTAVLLGASDIHIEPFEEEILVRLRVDGVLQTVASIPKAFQVEFISRVKVLSQLKIDEHRIPQDGRFNTNVEGQPVDVRVSIVPSYWGEKVVMRVLLKEGFLYDLNNLGLLKKDLELVKRYIQKPFGMILSCGPTGSGKTTTLYSFIQQIGVEKIDAVNISTVEDPIEYSIPRVTQIQIQPGINLTFASGLRALLRQDPDIIMVGEIRDRETADIAVRMSLTGRLLFSTLHTNDAVGAIHRLLDIGVEPYLICSTLNLVISQRLIRKLCLHCRESYEIDKKTLDKIKQFYDYEYVVKSLRDAEILGSSKNPFSNVRLFRANGCDQCDHTGYQGRTSVFELLELNEEIRELIAKTADYNTIKEAAIRNGFKTLSVDGMAKVILGVTDLNEVMKTTI